MQMILLFILIIFALVMLLYDYRSGIITTLMVITNFGEFIYVNPNLELGDFGGIGTINFTDLFWFSLIIVIFIKKDRLKFLNYKFSFFILFVLIIISLIIPFIINSFSIKDTISIIRPLCNLILLPYFIVTVTNIKELNYLEKVLTSMFIFFLGIQIYEYIMQKRIPIRLFERYSVFFSEDPFAVEFGGIKTGYIWSRITYLLPFNLFFACYYFFTDKKNYGLILFLIYITAIMIALSRIWVIGFVFFLLIISIFLLLNNKNSSDIKYKLFTLIGSFASVGIILFFTSSTFNQLFDIFLLRVDSINNLADKTDSSFLGREYIFLQMVSVWWEYPIFGTGFSTISRRLITNDLGIPNIMTIFGTAGIFLLFILVKQYYTNIKPFIKNNYILFASLASVMFMILLMSLFSIDMFYFNATGAMLFAFGNILLNIAKQESHNNE